LHSGPDINAPLDDQLLFGQNFTVTREDGAWSYGASAPLYGALGGYSGYVKTAHLRARETDANARISSLKAPVFSKPGLKSHIVQILSLGCRVNSGVVSGDYCAAAGGFIHRAHLGALDDYADDFVSIAERYLLLPYIWGGVSADGLDCSGLVQNALWAAGIECPRDASQQEAALGRAVEITPKLSGLERGDLIFWKGHVGIMMDGDWLIHANAYHMMTQIELLSEAQKRIAKTAGPITAIKRLG
jgi:cell wall-associated NlpC family hydrolase